MLTLGSCLNLPMDFISSQEGLKQLRTNLKRAKKGEAPLEGSDGKKTRNITPEA